MLLKTELSPHALLQIALTFKRIFHEREATYIRGEFNYGESYHDTAERLVITGSIQSELAELALFMLSSGFADCHDWADKIISLNSGFMTVPQLVETAFAGR